MKSFVRSKYTKKWNTCDKMNITNRKLGIKYNLYTHRDSRINVNFAAM